MKWDVGTLVYWRGVNLLGRVDFQVNVGQLIKEEYEVKFFEMEGVKCGGSVGNANDEFGGGMHEDDFVDMGVDANVEGLDGRICGRNVERGSSSTRFETPPRMLLALDGSEEVKKLSNENVELRRAINVLEDQLAEREVHNVTQAFRNVDVNPEGVNATPGRVVRDVVGTRRTFHDVGDGNRFGIFWPAVMWDGQAHGVAVYFTDVKSLVIKRDLGNDMMKNNNVWSRNRYVLDNCVKLFRFVHFRFAKTVYDLEDGSWKHFNSMRPRRNC
ncbi:hypothetical protein LOK49_LG10G01467 [Camellia lanceoleosa]|uniref:Uncharacterized protein n=1 Tax=Camellia lanceoleosa TaxID=1840588 RepID=A0ACC0GBK7_9ERIC|nr:hypothetical protein LOK49_LG10G01467 [Camellia lanceoleosa]